ncbi:serine/threonine-protein kinase [Mycobacterium paragordonae]|uniref:serine/threonine-protein kinase n=1 Tax=Mycobacterium paragordonae TaxID=1389713 RepID=UPI00105B619F|nr:serine/threonine protein kinase [Mycobacterium paragordonae]TDL06263.1 serine/threonine protein kinase [Mycobacterium paragordonae]
MAESSFGRYQLQGLLGRGGMGQVYRAYDTQTDRIVAIKLLPPNLAEDKEFEHRFRREARTAASLNDPHVVPIHSFGEIDGQLYVDMRLVEGRDLAKFIAENGGRLSPAQTVAIIEQTAAALDSAHQVGLVHRDVKPSNILVAKARNFVYLIDFGIARATTDTALTQTGLTMGTLAYLAPERFRGITDPRADVYALACTLYECLTGARPYPGDSFEEQISGHLHAPPPRPTAIRHDIPPAFDAVVARGMAKDPQARYQTVTELADAARAALGGAGMALPPPPPAEAHTGLAPSSTAPEVPAPDKASRTMLIATVAGSGLLLVLVAALVAIFSSGDDNGSNNPTTRTTVTTTSRAPETTTETSTDVGDTSGVEQNGTNDTPTESGTP